VLVYLVLIVLILDSRSYPDYLGKVYCTRKVIHAVYPCSIQS